MSMCINDSNNVDFDLKSPIAKIKLRQIEALYGMLMCELCIHYGLSHCFLAKDLSHLSCSLNWLFTDALMFIPCYTKASCTF